MNPVHCVLACALACASVASAAAELPTATAFPRAEQQKSLSVRHWQVIGADLASQAVAGLGAKTVRGVYVSPASEGSVFDRQLQVFFLDALLATGTNVFTAPTAGALEIKVSSMSATHLGAADTQRDFAATALAAGVLVVREIGTVALTPALMAAALATDLLHDSERAPTRTELAVTISVADQGAYVVRKSNVYYIDAMDVRVYNTPAPTKTLRVEGTQ